MNNPFYHSIAVIHGITGLVIFLTGVLQFIMNKGGKTHRLIGKIYNYAWIVIILTGAYIGSIVIVAIVLMGFYLSLTGIRLAVRKNEPYAAIDKTILAIAAVIVLFMVFAAIYSVLKQNYTIGIIATFFALLYSFVLSLDIRKYILNKAEPKYGKMEWYVSHLSRMQFSFITAVGAFTAVQNVFHNTVLNFILPALIGIVAVRISKRYFLKKLKLAEV